MRTKIIGIVVLALVAGLSLTCSPLYLIRAGIEEGKILSRRQPIARVIEDPATDEDVRRKLKLVLQARTFAREALELDAGDSYTTYSWIDRDTLALVLSAARKDRFEGVTWWFPIVGHVPYKGFFSLDQAREEAEKLEREGYDTYIRPTGAFSTLGWFNDPLLSTVLRYDDVSVVSTVIHELTHNTIYVPSQVAFNESFANFVGDRGAVEFFCGLEGDDGPRCRTARDRWADNLLFGRYLQDLIAELEAVYARTDLSREERLERRARVFRRARDRFVQEIEPRLRTPAFRSYRDVQINNARLIAWRLYYDRLHLFEAAYQRHNHDLAATITAIRQATAGAEDAPFAALESMVAPRRLPG